MTGLSRCRGVGVTSPKSASSCQRPTPSPAVYRPARAPRSQVTRGAAARQAEARPTQAPLVGAPLTGGAPAGGASIGRAADLGSAGVGAPEVAGADAALTGDEGAADASLSGVGAALISGAADGEASRDPGIAGAGASLTGDAPGGCASSGDAAGPGLDGVGGLEVRVRVQLVEPHGTSEGVYYIPASAQWAAVWECFRRDQGWLEEWVDVFWGARFFQKSDTLESHGVRDGDTIELTVRPALHYKVAQLTELNEKMNLANKQLSERVTSLEESVAALGATASTEAAPKRFSALHG